MRIVSWNVNGLRARLKQDFDKAIEVLKPDILCIQETRAKPDQLPVNLLMDYHHYFSIHNKPGYAGATTFTKEEPFLAVDDFPENDEPGRVSILDFKDFKLINAYVPNAGQQLERLDHRIEWQEKLENYIKSQMKPVIYCGDLNCAYKQIDVGAPSVKSGVSLKERGAFQKILKIGMVDAYRELYPDTIQYTWFSNFTKHEEVKNGMRIDAFIISKELMPLVRDVTHIYNEELVCNSDHVPIVLDIDLTF